MTQSNHSAFQVKLEGIKLSAEAESRIERGIQALVLQELAAYKPNPDDPDKKKPPVPPHWGGTIMIPNKEWLGIWLRGLDLKEFDSIKNTIGIQR